jgi:GT2 family glycosyltransferase
MKLGIVVLNWNGYDITPRCLDSIFGNSSLPDAVVVVDNASTDGSADLIRARYPQVVLIGNDRNLGFAAGCNLGIQYLLDRNFDFVLLLNNDAEVDPECLLELTKAAGAYPAAAYAPIIFQHDRPEEVWFSGGTIDPLTLEARHETRQPANAELPYSTGFLTGCCLLLRTDALMRIGLLDTRFFAYYEDVDWCLQAKALGYDLVCVPKATARHEVSHSFRRAGADRDGVSRFSWAQLRSVVLYLTYRNRLLLGRKHARNGLHLLFLMGRCLMRGSVHAGLLCLIGQTERAGAVVHGMSEGMFRAANPPQIHRYL